nr:MAG TPA: hypothetical protein [Caudoviricetes sp.]
MILFSGVKKSLTISCSRGNSCQKSSKSSKESKDKRTKSRSLRNTWQLQGMR